MSDEFLDYIEDILDGMRDRIIHGYNSINLRIVWDVVKVDIPELKPQIRKILEDYTGV